MDIEMEVDFRDREGGKAIGFLIREPDDLQLPIKRFRIHVVDADLVAGVAFEPDSFSDLVEFLTGPLESGSWSSDDGSWSLNREKSQEDRWVITSEIHSQLLYHPWQLITSLELDEQALIEANEALKEFMGVCE